MLRTITFRNTCNWNLTDRHYTKSTTKYITWMTKNLDNIYLLQPKVWNNYQFFKTYEYRHNAQYYNNIAPSHKTHNTNPVTRTWRKWNIQNYVQVLPRSLCRADKSKLKIKIPGTHTVHYKQWPLLGICTTYI